MKVLGMGNALVDVLAQIEEDSMIDRLGLVKSTMTLIDEDKYKELSLVLRELKASAVAGGSAANTIVGLANLGIEAAFWGQVAQDDNGDAFKRDLLANGAGLHLVVVEGHTGVASTFISKDGQRTFGTFLGVSGGLSEKDFKESVFRQYGIFYIEGYLVQSHELIIDAIKLAKQLGLKVALDLASYNIVLENLPFLKEIISRDIDILFANSDEAKALTGLDIENSLTTLSKHVEYVIIKDGANGSWVRHGEEEYQALPSAGVVCLDSTGAGDLYASGFLYGLIRGESLEVCGKIGTLLAEEVIQVIGPKIQSERWLEIKKIISEY